MRILVCFAEEDGDELLLHHHHDSGGQGMDSLLLPGMKTHHLEDEEDELDEDYEEEHLSPSGASVAPSVNGDHHAAVSLPVFLEEPIDTYVVKNKPATLICRAAHALNVSRFFKILL